MVGEKTALIATAHVSNVLGCELAVGEVVKLAREHGAKVLLDACQSVPHMKVDVQALGVDWIVASGHKMCGPTGIGFLWGRMDVLETMPPWMGGGEMIQDVYMVGGKGGKGEPGSGPRPGPGPGATVHHKLNGKGYIFTELNEYRVGTFWTRH